MICIRFNNTTVSVAKQLYINIYINCLNSLLFVCLVENQIHVSVKDKDKALFEYADHISSADKTLPKDGDMEEDSEQAQKSETILTLHEIQGTLIILLIFLLIFNDGFFYKTI